MEPVDAADHIREARELARTEEQREIERLRTGAAVIIAVLAMLLAIASLGGDNATKEVMNNNILASDTWAFYQAKNIRQTDNRLSADEIEASLLVHGSSISEEVRQAVQASIARLRAVADRYESEPNPSARCGGDGKKELLACASGYEEKRDYALKQDPNFDFSTALFQIAIVLSSVAILAASRVVLTLALGLGVIATILMLNGYLLFSELPGG